MQDDRKPEAKVGPVDPTLKTSAINYPDDGVGSAAGCSYNGVTYSANTIICANGRYLRCEDDGTWSDRGGPCT
jgi:hypothetical protein